MIVDEFLKMLSVSYKLFAMMEDSPKLPGVGSIKIPGHSIGRILESSRKEKVHAWMLVRGPKEEIVSYCFIFKAHAFNKKGEWWALASDAAGSMTRVSLSKAASMIENAKIERSRLSEELTRELLIESL